MYSETKINAQYKTGSNNISLVFLSFKHYFCISDCKSYRITVVILQSSVVMESSTPYCERWPTMAEDLKIINYFIECFRR